MQVFLSSEDKSKFSLYYRDLLSSSGDITSLHSITSLDYYGITSSSRFETFKDYSFIILKDNTPVFAFVCAIWDHENESYFGYGDCPSFIIENFKLSNSAIHRFAIKEIKKYIPTTLTNVNILLNGPFTGISRFWPQFFSTFSIDIDSRAEFTRIINLSASSDYLWQSVRKSYRPLINWGLKSMDIQIFDKNSITERVFEEFKLLHIHCSKRQTRSDASWDAHYKSILSDEAFLVSGMYKGSYIGFAYFTYNTSHCYYASAAYDRDLFDYPIAHSIIWRAIMRMRELGLTYFEIGTDYPVWLNSSFQSTSQKLRNISLFKSGFGGNLVPIVKIANY